MVWNAPSPLAATESVENAESVSIVPAVLSSIALSSIFIAFTLNKLACKYYLNYLELVKLFRGRASRLYQALSLRREQRACDSRWKIEVKVFVH
jgi:hypothetical protein